MNRHLHTTANKILHIKTIQDQLGTILLQTRSRFSPTEAVSNDHVLSSPLVSTFPKLSVKLRLSDGVEIYPYPSSSPP